MCNLDGVSQHLENLVENANNTEVLDMMNSSPSGANLEKDRLSLTDIKPFDLEIGQASTPTNPSKALSLDEIQKLSVAELADPKNTDQSLDGIMRSLHEVRGLTRRLSLRRQESLKQISSAAEAECPSIAWFRNHHRRAHGRIIKRSLSVGCGIGSKERLDTFSSKLLQISANQTLPSPPPPPPPPPPMPTSSKSVLVVPASPRSSSSSGSRSPKRRRSKRRLLTRCMSTPIIATAPQSPRQKRTKKRIGRSRTAPTRKEEKDNSNNNNSYFNWEDWAANNFSKNQHSSVESEMTADKKPKQHFLSRRSSLSCLIPTPEGSIMDQSFDWENHNMNLVNDGILPDISNASKTPSKTLDDNKSNHSRSSCSSSSSSTCSKGEDLDIFDWKGWAKTQSRRGGKEQGSRRKRTTRAASERHLKTSGSTPLQQLPQQDRRKKTERAASERAIQTYAPSRLGRQSSPRPHCCRRST